MKKSFLTILVAACAFAFVGCKTTENGQALKLAGVLAQEAAKQGTIYELNKNPAERPAFEAGKIALDGLLGDEDYDSAKLKAVIATLPLDIFKGSESAMYLQDGVLLIFDVLTATAFDVNSSPAAKAVMTGVRDGIEEGLAATATRSTTAKAKLRAPRPDYVIAPLKVTKL